ncbi:hypothetical protein JCM19231_4485 [Vibrio ishigakensis]|uniref:Uncharacterized protein n=2 Tax=Vibrio ishigakensis TaxID=1481914 RepID=A0A0B8NVH0_9VIBR|nr:hypothetical protein JCM19231_4485 [Vibrio ishigakensis]
MTNPVLLEEIKLDFEQKKAGREYLTLNDLSENPASSLTEAQRAEYQELLQSSKEMLLSALEK